MYLAKLSVKNKAVKKWVKKKKISKNREKSLKQLNCYIGKYSLNAKESSKREKEGERGMRLTETKCKMIYCVSNYIKYVIQLIQSIK